MRCSLSKQCAVDKSLRHLFFLWNTGTSRELNLGPLGEKQERYPMCCVLAPSFDLKLCFKNVIDVGWCLWLVIITYRCNQQCGPEISLGLGSHQDGWYCPLTLIPLAVSWTDKHSRLVWWWRPELVWKGCRQSETALPYARLKESDWFHPQLCPHTRGQLQNVTNFH